MPIPKSLFRIGNILESPSRKHHWNYVDIITQFSYSITEISILMFVSINTYCISWIFTPSILRLDPEPCMSNAWRLSCNFRYTIFVKKWYWLLCSWTHFLGTLDCQNDVSSVGIEGERPPIGKFVVENGCFHPWAYTFGE